ncbi:hypothetical protein H8S95_06555 [Pontibacter sp. KCTC 32443]|uniref:hypothetical protein n=1 Tax=Pontibacter TaxID=323449 RepID=UPI00164D3F92|nr:MULTISPECIES: hypothetical protein [Pontibacter]MBC5773717.1 hypothetical protein [Pontibacter sp. KCTC 32443]
MNRTDGISLQINISPSDYLLCRKLLQFQINFFYNHIDEVVLTIESKKSKGKRFGNNFNNYQDKLNLFLESLRNQFPKIRVVPVDYSPDAKKKVAKLFFSNTKFLPDKDFRGGPFYCYFFGLYSCAFQKILHLDCDMILGGDAKHWLTGAIKLLNDPSVAFVLPLSGPPTSEFNICQSYTKRLNRYTYVFDRFTTRVFLTDITKFTNHKLFLKLIKPNIKRIGRALLQQNFWEMPEVLITENIRRTKTYRVDYWGENDQQGCYSLHPVYKPASFIEFVPKLLEQVQNNKLPNVQKGNYDLIYEAFMTHTN